MNCSNDINEMVCSSSTRPKLRLSIRLSSYLFNGVVKIQRKKSEFVLGKYVKITFLLLNEQRYED